MLSSNRIPALKMQIMNANAEKYPCSKESKNRKGNYQCAISTKNTTVISLNSCDSGEEIDIARLVYQ